METVFRRATHPDTGDKYQIELPDPAVIRQAILELSFPPDGMTIKNAEKILAEKFELSEAQKNAVYKSGDNIFYHGVQTQFRNLLEEGKLKQSGGEGTPYSLENPPITDLSRVLEIIADIVEKSADGAYIYRGEPECYEKVSSSLYREYPHREGTHFDIVSAQKDILAEAKAYIGKTDDVDETDDIGILTALQHFLGKTNLIDFTEDYLIALFFACDGSHDKDGRVILLKRESDDYAIRKPRRTISRVESQKSVFVESFTGFVEPDIEVPIPADLKLSMLDYLKKHHRISIETIYNDLHGFIRRGAYGEFLKGLTCQSKSEEAKTLKEKREHRDNAIKHYTEALKLNDEYAEAYNNRGIAYAEKGEFDKALQDFSKAITLKPPDAAAYSHRGEAWLHLSKWENAKEDLITAKDMGIDIAAAFHNAYESVEDFEAKRGVKMPEDIAALLRGEEIKQRFAIETKPLVQTEGPLDVRYIERALDVLEKTELLNSVDIEFVGIVDEDGRTRFGGDTGLNRFRNTYEANSSLYHRPILLLYDCDTQRPNEQIEKLWVRSIPKNDENTKVRKGIENLFPEALFTEDFYSEARTDDGGYAKRLDKSRFCEWICENGTATDFAEFKSVVQILEEFVEAN